MNVFHCTPSEFEFSNKSLLDIAYPQQWTTTYEDVDSYKIYTSRRLEIQAKYIEQTLHQLKILMDAKTDSCCTQDSPAFTTEATLASPTVASTAYNPLTNIAVAAIAVGTMAWIYARLTN
ncbi:unnamed protein product [Brassica rapa subsp. trilocularis]